MKRLRLRHLSFSWLVLLLIGVPKPPHLAAQSLPAATPKDYAQWHTMSPAVMSEDGNWIAWTLTMQENNDTLWVKHRLTGKSKSMAFASQPRFSGDHAWLAVRIGVSYAEQEKLTEQKKSVEYALGLVKLADLSMETIKNVTRFEFSDNGKWLAVTLGKPADSKAAGSTVLLRNLSTGLTRSIGNVTESAFNKASNRFAYITHGGSIRTVELVNLASLATLVVSSDTTQYTKLTWDKKGQTMAFFKEKKDPKYLSESQTVHFYTATAASPQLKQYELPSEPYAGWRIFGGSNLSISDDGQRVHFGIKPWERKPEPDTTKGKKPATKEKLAPVDVWSWNDKEIQPRQKITYTQDLNRSWESVWFVQADKMQLLADSLRPEVNSSMAHTTVIAWHSDTYKPAFKNDLADFYLVDAYNGQKRLLLQGQPMGMGSTPSTSTTGRYVHYFKDLKHYLYDTRTQKTVYLSANIPQPVHNVRDDRPGVIGPAAPSYWLKGDARVLLHDEFDVWSVLPDGSSPRRLTQGREQKIIYRIVRLNLEEPALDPAELVMLSMTGDHDMQSGYASLDLRTGQVRTELFEPKSISRLTKADKAKVYSFVSQRYNEPPALHLGTTLASASKVYASNPQAANYAWGKSEMVYFTSRDGRPLKGALYYPANYEPGKQYPMIVYIYEILSNGLHQYVNPSVRSAYNTSHYTSQGYFVFRPDIVYALDDPGVSAVNCVVPAVETVLKTGMIRADGVGLMGHSWGGYQTAFLVTQTDLFKAAIAGAPLTNMMSMSLAIYWNTGSPNQKIFETSQGRFSGPWYETEEAHRRNSPIIFADKINTPTLMTFGDKDGAVDWHQGIELYGTMRRMGKPFTMLVYADENHNFTKRENQMDYFNRVTQFLDHYLKGAPAPSWLKDGVPYLERKKKEDQSSKTN
jgi:dipeptidyl aminopeptidase/acylaminoacyl peptidase